MFDFVHEKKRFVQIILLLIILPFAFWGVDSYRRSGGDSALATVNGEKITQPEFENVLQQQSQRMREMLGAGFDPAMFDRAELKNSILDSLVTQKLHTSEASRVGLRVGDGQLAEIISGIPAFQAEGKFDKARYESALASQNMSPLMFEARVRQELVGRQLSEAYLQNGYVSERVVERLIQLNEQQRVISLLKFDSSAYSKQTIPDADIRAYYESNSTEFRLPERARVEYVTFSAQDMQSHVVISDDEVQAYYKDHQAEFGSQELRRAAHILIALSKNASAGELAEGEAKAQALLQQVKQNPAKFAELAKVHSQDPGSAVNGGDLGEFGRGAMVKPFEEAVFALKTGEVSGLVRSDFGLHIIKLISIKPALVQPLAAVRGLISDRLKEQKSKEKFAELAEQFSNAVYEQSDSLKPAADLVGGKVMQSDWLEKNRPASGLWTGKVLQAIFADEVVKDKRNTAAIEYGDNALIAARVMEYQSASTKTFEDVSAQIREKLQREKAAKLAEEAGQSVLSKLQGAGNVQLSWSSAKSITRAQHEGVDGDLVPAIFKAPIAKLPAFVGGKTSQGYAVVRIEKVIDGSSVDENKRARYAQQVRQITGEELLRAYTADAKQRADINMTAFKDEVAK